MKGKQTEPTHALVAAFRSLGMQAIVKPAGLELPEDLPLDSWLALGNSLTGIEGSMRWWLGDWLNFGERRYGEKYRQAMAVTGYEYQSLADMKYVAHKFPLSRRRENLSWSHHREVVALPAEKADALLDQAEAQGWSRSRFRDEAAKARKPGEWMRVERGQGPKRWVQDIATSDYYAEMSDTLQAPRDYLQGVETKTPDGHVVVWSSPRQPDDQDKDQESLTEETDAETTPLVRVVARDAPLERVRPAPTAWEERMAYDSQYVHHIDKLRTLVKRRKYRPDTSNQLLMRELRSLWHELTAWFGEAGDPSIAEDRASEEK